MRVLVLESEQGGAASAVAELTAAGHDVSRCHDGSAAAFPCNGLLDHQHCPLESHDVDVALVVRSDGAAEPTAGEDGARCALRRSVPLVVAGETGGSPYTDFAAAVHAGTSGLAEVVEAAADAPLHRHVAAAQDALQVVFDHHGVDDPGAEVSVIRTGGDLRVIVRPTVALEPVVAEMASVRVGGAIRKLDPYPSVIDVSVEPMGARGSV